MLSMIIGKLVCYHNRLVAEPRASEPTPNVQPRIQYIAPLFQERKKGNLSNFEHRAVVDG